MQKRIEDHSLSNARSEEESLTIKRQPYDLPSATYY
jgi:hypothetical protein